MQIKTQSAIEVVCSTALAFAISVAAGQIIYPIYGMKPSLGMNAEITLWFTVISIVRSYLTRRFFNWLHR
jgi:hypothetical protein